MAQNIKLVPGELGEGYCFTSFQALYVRMMQLAHAELPSGYVFPIVQHAEPDPSDQDKIWHRLTTSGGFERTYKHHDGRWLSPHPTPPSSSERRLWFGTEAELETYDGGSSGRVTDMTGPMWMVDTAASARFLLGVGTLPSGTVVPVGGTGGEEKHELTKAEMPEHSHEASTSNPSVQNVWGYNSTGGTTGSSTGTQFTQVTIEIEPEGEGEAHNNMPPYIGAYVIQRTARKYYTAD